MYRYVFRCVDLHLSFTLNDSDVDLISSAYALETCTGRLSLRLFQGAPFLLNYDR